MSFTAGLEGPRYVQHCSEKPWRKQRGREITTALCRCLGTTAEQLGGVAVS